MRLASLMLMVSAGHHSGAERVTHPLERNGLSSASTSDPAVSLPRLYAREADTRRRDCSGDAGDCSGLLRCLAVTHLST